MIFNEVLGIQETNHDTTKLNNREAVRAIIIKDKKILLVHSNLGDYKFPGGGLEKGESHAVGLAREVKEETGYHNAVIGRKIGIVIERYKDEYVKEAVFQMTSHYYLCKVTSEQGTQQLDDYEKEQDFTPKWVPLEDAIKQNQETLNKCVQNGWIHRENFVLKELIKYSPIEHFVKL
ncbi:NUDIX hydrolase [Sutcliffiella halmapala]|uniref:NUDIX hydrolase n=1 Tax=Sutcliffiella halmapala TaxID=79882 RepID=UPI000994BBB4|nr:NUDIX domain-containing protein [Sutcliffiella halmapala]